MDKLGNIADANMRNWPEAVRKFEQYPVDGVVPGHGDQLEPALLLHILDLLGATP